MSFIDHYREVFGVESICRVLAGHGLKIAPSTYYAAKARPVSARAVRDARLKTQISDVWRADFEVYGGDCRKLEAERERRERGPALVHHEGGPGPAC
ncbi:hypothetical protein [Actinoallomurus sp. CA-150999]|uniref:hypothetical protein n=1 Tax=Actinoallomurus sp. CA-150999 TaxID=3239887 RepID=UPI003D8B207F